MEPQKQIPEICSSLGVPKKYQGAIFSAQHGSWNRTIPVGARVMVTYLKDDGTADKMELFAEGWLNENANISAGPSRRSAARRLASCFG